MPESQPESNEHAAPLTGEELFRHMAESAKDYAVFATDREGRVVGWNAGAERIFGYAEGELIGQHGSVLFTHEDRESGAPALELEKAAAEGRAEDERWHLRKDGSRFWASGMVTPLRDGAGNLRGFIKVARDMTERRQAEERRARRETHAALRADVSLALARRDHLPAAAGRGECEDARRAGAAASGSMRGRRSGAGARRTTTSSGSTSSRTSLTAAGR